MLKWYLLFALTFLSWTSLRELASLPFLLVITIASGPTSTGATIGLFKKAPSSRPCSYVPFFSAVVALEESNFWRCLASLFYAFMRKLWQTIAKPTTPGFLDTDFICNAVKTAPMNTAFKLIKNVPNSPTKKHDPKLKDSVVHLISPWTLQLLTVVCDGVELKICILKAGTGRLRQESPQDPGHLPCSTPAH